jgi:hypothetical protein
VDSSLANGGINAGSKLPSARERLLQNAGGSAAAPGQSSTMIILIAFQQAPEWFQPLPLILPASRLWLIDKMVSGDSKRKRNGELASSDEESWDNRGGYGEPKARFAQTSSRDNSKLVLEIILRDCN